MSDKKIKCFITFQCWDTSFEHLKFVQVIDPYISYTEDHLQVFLCKICFVLDVYTIFVCSAILIVYVIKRGLCY